MRVKNTRKPVIDQSEVMVLIELTLYWLWNAYFHYGGEHSVGVSCTFELRAFDLIEVWLNGVLSVLYKFYL